MSKHDTPTQTPPTPKVGEACRLHRTHHGRSEATRARSEAKGTSESAPENCVIGTGTLKSSAGSLTSGECLAL
jgi:hypothetical protein